MPRYARPGLKVKRNVRWTLRAIISITYKYNICEETIMNEPINVVIESLPIKSFSIIELLNSLLTPLIAIIAIYIAYRQYRNDNTRLKFELYEKRLEVYKKLQTFITQVIREGTNIDIGIIHKFHEETFVSSFLFNRNIQEYLEKIYKKSVYMWQLNKKLYPSNGIAGLTVGEERSKVCEEETNILLWITDQADESIQIFKEYLHIV